MTKTESRFRERFKKAFFTRLVCTGWGLTRPAWPRPQRCPCTSRPSSSSPPPPPSRGRRRRREEEEGGSRRPTGAAAATITTTAMAAATGVDGSLPSSAEGGSGGWQRSQVRLVKIDQSLQFVKCPDVAHLTLLTILLLAKTWYKTFISGHHRLRGPHRDTAFEKVTSYGDSYG